MADRYRSFAELARYEVEGRDWVRSYLDRASGILVMAPHGGWIEPHTMELARAIAGEDFSFYAFQGLKDTGNQDLHLTSHCFDEPLALSAVSEADTVLAIHGERTQGERFVMVGGREGKLCEAMARALTESGFLVLPPRRGLGGRNPANICNRGRAGCGVQLEISEGLRKEMDADPARRARFVDSIRRVLLEEGGSVGGGSPGPTGWEGRQ